MIVADAELAHFATHRWVVLRGALDPAPLADELDRAMADGVRGSFGAEVGGAPLTGQYLPMMCELTPVSLALLDRLAPVAARLLGAPVLPVRAKGVRYGGATAWHVDSEREVPSVGFLAYLEPLTGDTGALRVRPPETTLDTVPGDLIVLDEHVEHASRGGRDRRQWRVDYVVDPVGAAAEAAVRAYFAAIYPPDWDGGYDVDRYPSYGAHWQGSGRAAVARLRALGVYDLAAAEEAFARGRR